MKSSTYFRAREYMLILNQTRMHSSRMRTVRYSGRVGCLPKGECLPKGCLPKGVFA